MILQETNKDIEWMVRNLDSKVKIYKTKYPNSPFLKIINKFYNEVIVVWMENYPMSYSPEEPDREMDEIIKKLYFRYFIDDRLLYIKRD